MDLYYVPFDEIRRVRNLPAFPAARIALFASVCRINTLYMITRAGSGHIGTSFSCIDIVCWLFLNKVRVPDLNQPGATAGIYFSSKGHDAPALYSVLIGLGLLEFDLIHKLRRLGGLPGHPEVSTPFVHTNTGSLGMGVSKAKGMVLANRLKGRSEHIYVLAGDGELQEGQIWESLQGVANLGLGEITLIVDHNKLQSDSWVADVSPLGDLGAKFRAFGWHVVRCDGHNITQLEQAFIQMDLVADRPKILIADTLKGKGVSFMEPEAMDPEERLYRFHSGAPDADTYSNAAAELIESANSILAKLDAAELRVETAERPADTGHDKVQRLVNAYSTELLKQAEGNPRLVVLDADLMCDCGLMAFRRRYPDRFFECGVAEQDMISQAGGMALRGLLPVVHSFACFLSARPNEQIYNNATERTKIIYVGSLAGLLPAAPGHSHQAVRDISVLGAIPDLILIEPSCEAEVEMAFDFCVNRAKTSCYLRLVSVPTAIPFLLPLDYRMELGKGVTLREGSDGVVIAYGPVMLSQAYRAATLLEARDGIELSVVNLPWLNRVHPTWLSDMAARHRWIFTIDNHYLAGGQGQTILSQLVELPSRPIPRVKRYGISGIPLCGEDAEILQAHRLDAESLAKDIALTLANDHSTL